jgi:hypothetical protein
MVTKQQIETLRAQRSTLTPVLDLTPNNAAFASIGAAQDRVREDSIEAIERAFRDAKRDMRREYELARSKGHTRAIFNQPNQQRQKVTP